MPVDLRKADLETSAAEYVAALKYDGERFIFVCLGGRAAMVARNGTKYDLGATESGPNCILDGEMVQTSDTSDRWGGVLFCIFDAVVIDDEFIGSRPYLERLQSAGTIVSTLGNARCRMGVKPVAPVENLLKLRAPDGVDTDGYVFTMKSEGVVAGRAATIKKWKPVEKLTVDLLVRGGEIFCNDRSRLVSLDFQVERLSDMQDDSVWEFRIRLSGPFFEAIPVREREDKLIPNSIATVTAVLDQVRDPVQKTDLVGWCQPDGAFPSFEGIVGGEDEASPGQD